MMIMMIICNHGFCSLFQDLIQEVYTSGPNREGIFRLAGNLGKKRTLKEWLDQKLGVDFSVEDVVVCANVLKVRNN